MLVTLIAGLICRPAPALQALETDVNEALKEGGRDSMQGLRQNRPRTVLVISEVALSLVLFIGAGLMIVSFLRLLNVNPGFNAQNLLTMRFTLLGAK